MTSFEIFARRSEPLSTKNVARLAKGRLEGNGEMEIRGIAPLHEAGEGDLALLARRRYLRHLPQTNARAALVSEELAGEAKTLPARIVVDDPHEALALLLPHFHPLRTASPGIHPTAVLGRGVALGEKVHLGPYVVLEEGVAVGDGTRIGAHSVVGAGCTLGSECVLHPHVVLYPDTRLGDRVTLHSGVRLGSDGFGYVPGPDGARKVPQVGGCRVEDDVEIGANSCVDRGSIGHTVVGKGTKLDNLVHLGHNVRVGRGVLMAAMAGVSGSTRIGDGAMVGGQAGLVGHIEIGEGARLGAQAGVIGDVPAGEAVSGYPARNNREYLRAMSLALKLPAILRELGSRLDALEGGGPHGSEDPADDEKESPEGGGDGEGNGA
jgi:UDP-3-O-[3-hydroxymyristoyl] glucosamine N-acyltransferase